MPNDVLMRTLTVPAARGLLLSRDELRATGLTDRELSARVDSGELRRVRRGRYVHVHDWNDLWSEGRHLLEVVAVEMNSEPPGPLLIGVSAAVLHGLPLYRTAPRQVHAAIEGRRHTRNRMGIHWHDVTVPAEDITAIDGIRCTSLDRTVLDITATMHREAAVAAADAALRRVAVIDGHHQDAALAGTWRDVLSGRAHAVSTRGIRQAREVISFADGRAQLPGESVSRLQLHRLGFRSVRLQEHIIGPDGESYWLDFAFERSRCFGEFDGRGKYTDPSVTGGATIEDIVMAEKRREDAVRGVTGWGLGRWESSHIRTPDALGARLQAFGIRPP